MKKYLYILISILAVSCSKSDTDVQDFGYGYFPIELGSATFFDVEHSYYDDFSDSVLTENYELTEVLDSVYFDLEGRVIHQISRYTRIDTSYAWGDREVVTFHRGDHQLEFNEGNTIFVKMVFPLRRGNTWDGNSRNGLDAETYTILNLDLKSTVNEISFERTTRINHRSNVNLIEEQVKEEVYAYGVGLIELKDTDLTYDQDGAIKSGYKYSQKYSKLNGE